MKSIEFVKVEDMFYKVVQSTHCILKRRERASWGLYTAQLIENF